MEDIKQNTESLPTFFKQNRAAEIAYFLESNVIVPGDFNTLGDTVAKDSNSFISICHNLFISQQEKSLSYLAYLKDGWVRDLEQEKNAYMIQKLKNKLAIVEAFITFTQKYGWHKTNATVYELEESLK